ncbi:TIGR02391 family protein [Kribbella sp. NPDC050241]|uniref:TIGR02391 family protein n=1 Tax=Kribbella sp. NPDC050241 TaxID=3364115 RepID=UPI003798B348
MMRSNEPQQSIQLAQRIAGDVAEFSRPTAGGRIESIEQTPLDPAELLLAEYDRRVIDTDLRAATRSRFISAHYADAIEASVKALNECVRGRTGLALDGDGLMTTAFSVGNPLLRLNRLRSDSDKSEQRGHMMMCQGVVAAWRNPRAHSSQFEDSPLNTIMMLEHVQHLMSVTKAATRSRRRRSTP